MVFSLKRDGKRVDPRWQYKRWEQPPPGDDSHYCINQNRLKAWECKTKNSRWDSCTEIRGLCKAKHNFGDGHLYPEPYVCLGIEGELTEPSHNVFANGRCDDNFQTWQLISTKLPYSEAQTFCANKDMKLACPLTDQKFYDWLQLYELQDYAWFAGTQQSGIYHNYMKWESGLEISRHISKDANDAFSGQNLWDFEHPKYAPTPTYCVKALKLLRSEDCTTPLEFFCSKIDNA